MRIFKVGFIAASGLLLNGCEPASQPVGKATQATLAAYTTSSEHLLLDEPLISNPQNHMPPDGLTANLQTDSAAEATMHEAYRGLIARPQGVIRGPDGQVLVNFADYQFLQGEMPDTVHPSLWRHAKLNAQAGLFKVTERIYQLRGFDLANMTLIEGDQGWIVVDPLTSEETAAAALAFAKQQLGDKPITAVIFTHSHVDHFGGVLGILSEQEAKTRGVPIVAPAGFMAEATSENVLVGPAMSRRSIYQFGKNLSTGVDGFIDAGLGKRVGYGTIGILAPTITVSEPRQTLVIDGLEFIFHNTPGAEAPAEFIFSIPALKAFAGTELLAQTMHNFLPVRGAKVRDVLQWSAYLQQALDELGDAEVYFGQHNWPIWGNNNIREFISKHRDVYKYLHDQTLRLANSGATPKEIAEQIELPKALASYFGTRGYYGDIRHNVKAIYQLYLGAYDGNPAHLNPLPPSQVGPRYIELMGGADKVLLAAQKAFADGDYRWVAELLNHLVFAEPENQAAKSLLAETYQQLGYQSEASTWRNSYLTAAQELKQGPPAQGVDRKLLIGLMARTPTERFLEAMAASLNGPAADEKQYMINLKLIDADESYVLWLENSVLHHRAAEPDPKANATLQISKMLLVRLLAGAAGLEDIMSSDEFQLTGSTLDFVSFMRLIDKAPSNFAIVTPE